MKRLMMAASATAICAALSFTSPSLTRLTSTAAAYTVYHSSPMLYMSRDPLAGTTRMRVHNNTSYPIIAIRSSNAQYGMTYRWGSPLAWAGGMIPPHSIREVDFGDRSAACIFYIEIRTANGLTHVFGNVNVCAHNDLIISDW